MVPDEVFSVKKDLLRYDNEYKVIKGFIDSEQIYDAFKYLSDLQSQLDSSITNHDQVIIDVLLCSLQDQAKKIHENLELISKLESSIQDQLMLFDFTIAKAGTFWRSGRQVEALQALNAIEGPFSDFKAGVVSAGNTNLQPIIDRESDIQNLKGIISWLLGDVLTAQVSFQESLRLRRQLGNKKKIASSLNNLGIFYTYMGDLQIALEHYNDVIELLKDFPNQLVLGYPYANIGEIYQHMGHFGYAFDFYNLALEILEPSNDNLAKAKVYYLVFNLHLESNNPPEAEVYLDKLRPLDDPPGENSYIHTLVVLAEGLMLKSSDSLIKKFKSVENFEEISNGPVIDSDLTAHAIFYLNDILLLETKLSNNDQNITKIQSWINKLIVIAEDQKSPVLLIQCYICNSKLKLLEFKVAEAKEILSKAHNLATEKGLMKFEYIIAREINQLLSQEQQWIALRSKDAGIVERIELAGLEKTLDNLIHKRQDKPELIDLLKKSIGQTVQNLHGSELKNEQIMENFYKYILNETYITIFRMSTLGPVIYISDELSFTDADKELIEIKLGVYFTTAIGQGENNNIGVFGPLPFPDNPEYYSLIYSCFMTDPENEDPRAKGRSYCLYVVTFPKLFEPYYDNKHFLTKIFENFHSKFDKIQEITRKDLDELKVNLVK